MKLTVITPQFGGQNFDLWRKSIDNLKDLCREVGIEYKELTSSDPSCPRCRNDLTHLWYNYIPDSEVCLHIDADIVFHPRDVLEMVATDRPLVGMVYPGKDIDWIRVSEAERKGLPGEAYASRLIVQVKDGATVDPDGTLEVEYLPTGMMCIRRSLIDGLIEAIGSGDKKLPVDIAQMKYLSDTPVSHGKEVWNWFQMPVIDEPNWGKRLLSEDWFFSRLCMDLGFQPRLFVGKSRPANLGHVGMYTFRGSVTTMLPWENKEGALPGTSALETVGEPGAPPNWEMIPGWNSDIAPFFAAVENHIPEGGTYVEVGVFLGRNLGAVHAKRPDLRLIAIDKWEDGVSQGYGGAGVLASALRSFGSLWNGFHGWMRAFAYEAYLKTEVIRLPSQEGLLTLADESVDFIFIDAAHDEENVLKDIEIAMRKVKPLGVVAGHDYSQEFPGVMLAVDKLLPHAQKMGTCWWVTIPAPEDQYDED